MIPDDPGQPRPSAPTASGSHVDSAIASLRSRTDARWVEVSDAVRRRAMQVTRRSLAVHAQAPGGPVHVSEQVLITYVRSAVGDVPGGRLEDITIAADALHRYTGITLYISVDYGYPILPIADTMRDLAASQLGALLGDVAPPVTVTTMHVHVQDVHTRVGETS